jgi:hypothetical protein
LISNIHISTTIFPYSVVHNQKLEGTNTRGRLE